MQLTGEALDEAWALYKETGFQGYRDRLLLHYSSLVRYVAAKLGATLPPSVDREDLISDGMIGLMDAIEKYDLDKGTKFETYAVTRIKGAMIDKIRTLDWVPRSVRSKARDIDRAREELESQLGRAPRHGEVASALGLTVQEFWQLNSEATVSTVESSDRSLFGPEGEARTESHLDPGANLESIAESNELLELLAEAIADMDQRSRTILVLYYLQEMTLADIGKLLGLTNSRVCQLQGKALRALQDSLGAGGLAA